MSFKKNQVHEAIEKCNFEKLTNQEREGFQEAADDKNGSKKKFFILDLKIIGNPLDKKIIDQLEFTFKEEMSELGYL